MNTKQTSKWCGINIPYTQLALILLSIFFSSKVHAQANCVNELISFNLAATGVTTTSRPYTASNVLYPTDALLTGYGSGTNNLYRVVISNAPIRLKVLVDLSILGSGVNSTNASMTVHSACLATIANRIESFTGGNNQYKYVTFPTNGTYFFVFDEGNSASGTRHTIAISKNWETVQAGDWNDPATWLFNQIPDTSLGLVELKHDVFINAPAAKACGTIVTNASTLTINSGAVLTTGTSSMGSAYGNSNRSVGGNITMDGGTLNINGGFSIGNFNFSGGTINIDPNDGNGTSGSIWSRPAITINGVQNVTGGNINILDPQYAVSNGYVNDCVINYNGAGNVFWGEGCTVTFGGGDDTYSFSDEGYEISCRENYGIFTFGTVVIASGNSANKKPVTVFTNFSCINLTVNAGAELVNMDGTISIRKNLINNGIITCGEGGYVNFGNTKSGLVFAIDVIQKYNTTTSKFYCDFVAADYPQSISGTGFFRNSLTATIPTMQANNYINKFQVYNNATNGGLTLNMPLITERLNIGTGKVNTTNTNILTLGIGSGTNATGILNAIPLSEQNTPLTPASIANWNTGWVDGPFKRWFAAANNTAEKTVMPLGESLRAQPASIGYTTAPTTAGYLIGTFKNTAPIGGNTIALMDPAIIPPLVTITNYGFWEINSPATIGVIGGNYTSSFLANNFGLTGFNPNLAVVKRATASNSVTDWALPGTHVASTDAGGNLVSRTGQSGFSEFSIAQEYFSPLANNDVLISGKLIKDLNQIKIYTELNSGTIEILRGNKANLINTKIYSQSLNNNKNFVFDDKNTTNTNNFYQAKVIDNLGKIYYSKIISLKSKSSILSTVFPNPTNGNVELKTKSLTDDKLTIQILDFKGSAIFTKVKNVSAGENVFNINLLGFSSGNYVIKIHSLKNNSTESIILFKN